uniref:DUF3618 domain-containing protein n=1 Tax=Mesocestoides corti TaxID=53468 RepID=A0A5K3F199_MESCO
MKMSPLEDTQPAAQTHQVDLDELRRRLQALKEQNSLDIEEGSDLESARAKERSQSRLAAFQNGVARLISAPSVTTTSLRPLTSLALMGGSILSGLVGVRVIRRLGLAARARIRQVRNSTRKGSLFQSRGTVRQRSQTFQDRGIQTED